ncbi:hypothetical protein AB0J48_20655 [Nocardia salmonicida]|uniref:hypothetical protein n=1 Tax=Nocardia salmonicida TaxID=53431 RepID=UPI00341DB9CA
MTASRDLVAEAHAMANPPIGYTSRGPEWELRKARNLLTELADELANLRVVSDAERDLLVASVQRETKLRAHADQLTTIRALASQWAAQSNDYGGRVGQQIEDGCALLLLIDGRTLPEETPNA